jgi:tetratricopeptide (TPR) repeat protein
MLNDIQEEKIELKKEEEYLKEKKKFNELGNFYNDQCRFTEAKDSYKKAIALNADESSSGLFALGYLHLKLNELEEAKSCLTEGINRKELEHKRIKEDGGSIWVSPTHDPEYSLEFGEIYEKQGLLKEAEACYKKAINFDKGDDFDAPYVKGVKQVPIKDGDRGTNYILGVFYEKQNRLAEAENCYKEASQKFDDTYSSYRLGKLYEKQNKLTEAEACYKKAAKKEEPHLIFNLWAFYKKHGKSNEEKELVQQISSENGKDETSAFMKSLDERIKKGFSLEDCGPVLSLSLMEFYDISKM